jgi:probable addiction module antidote protein
MWAAGCQSIKLKRPAARGELASIRAAIPHTRSTGPVATQGDFAQRSDVVRTTYPILTGTGVTVGVLSDSFDCYSVYANPANHVPASGSDGYAHNGFTADYATDVSTGALPSGVKVLAEPEPEANVPCLNSHTLGVVARARGMMKLSKDTGITRAGLYKALSPDGNPSFETVTKIIGAFGMRLSAQAA